MSDISFNPSSKNVIIALECRTCGAKGTTVWEKEDWGPSLVRVSDGFYERLEKLSSFNIEIICRACGTAQPVMTPKP